MDQAVSRPTGRRSFGSVVVIVIVCSIELSSKRQWRWGYDESWYRWAGFFFGDFEVSRAISSTERTVFTGHGDQSGSAMGQRRRGIPATARGTLGYDVRV